VSVARLHATWLSLVQAFVCDAIENVIAIDVSTRASEDAVRLWIGPINIHHTAWFEVSVSGEITATTRGGGQRLMLDGVSIDDLGVEAARLLAWVARGPR
jgi:hypothetical protein